MTRIDRTETYLNTLPLHHQELLTKYRDHLHRIRNCIDENFQIIRKLTEDVGNMFENADQSNLTEPYQNGNNESKVRLQDLDKVKKRHIKWYEEIINIFVLLLKVQVTMKQIARDWSSDGEEERRQCYKPIIDEIESFYRASDV